MRLGTVKVVGFQVLSNGEVKQTVQTVGGIEVSNVKEIVINNIVHEKNGNGTWTQFGTKRKIIIKHEAMVNKIHNASANSDRFDVWVSGYTINVKDRSLETAGKLPAKTTRPVTTADFKYTSTSNVNNKQ